MASGDFRVVQYFSLTFVMVLCRCCSLSRGGSEGRVHEVLVRHALVIVVFRFFR